MNCEALRIAMENAYAEYLAAWSVYVACVAKNGSANCEALYQLAMNKLAAYNAAQAAYFACLESGVGQ